MMVYNNPIIHVAIHVAVFIGCSFFVLRFALLDFIKQINGTIHSISYDIQNSYFVFQNLIFLKLPIFFLKTLNFEIRAHHLALFMVNFLWTDYFQNELKKITNKIPMDSSDTCQMSLDLKSRPTPATLRQNLISLSSQVPFPLIPRLET